MIISNYWDLTFVKKSYATLMNAYNNVLYRNDFRQMKSKRSDVVDIEQYYEAIGWFEN
jgi:DNA-binding transcriptional regulator PaaX